MSWIRLPGFALASFVGRALAVWMLGGAPPPLRGLAVVIVALSVFGTLGYRERRRPLVAALAVAALDLSLTVGAAAAAGLPGPPRSAVGVLLLSGACGVAAGRLVRRVAGGELREAARVLAFLDVPPEKRSRFAPLPAIGALAGGALAAAVTVVAANATGLPRESFTRDVVTVLGGSPATGFVSTLGILVLAGAAAVCWSGARALRRHGREADARFLARSGVVSTVLALDDAFLLHENVVPENLGVPETGVYLAYAVLLASWLGQFAPAIVRTEYGLLLGALALLGGSVLVDQTLVDPDHDVLLEEALKFSGILLWSVYFWRASGAACKR